MIMLHQMADRPNCNYAEFFCDYLSEIDLLPTTTTKGNGDYKLYEPCVIGSSCYCFENGEVYLLSSSGWVIA